MGELRGILSAPAIPPAIGTPHLLMKFLCGNCKAKYQIADVKIAGRTLRMKCRRCGHDIIIKGDGGARRSSVPGPPAAAFRWGPEPHPIELHADALTTLNWSKINVVCKAFNYIQDVLNLLKIIYI